MVVDFKDLPNIRKKHAKQRIVLASGVFDLLHNGHLTYLQSLKQFGDVVVVLVKSDNRVRKGKGTARPVIPERDRVRLVAAIKGVDYAFIGPNHNFTEEFEPINDQMYLKSLNALRPDVFYSTNPVWGALAGLGLTEVIIGVRATDASLKSTTDIINHIIDTHS